MKAKLVKESLNRSFFLNDIRDAIVAGEIYAEAPSKYDPDVAAYYIPFLSNDSKIFYYDLIGGSDVYGIHAVDQNGIVSFAPGDIAGGTRDENEIMEEIQNQFPTPPSNMEEISQVYSLEEFIQFYHSQDDVEN
jgi:hypothetical protein